MFVVWIIITALDHQQPVAIELVVNDLITAWPAEITKGQPVCLVEQPASTHGRGSVDTAMERVMEPKQS